MLQHIYCDEKWEWLSSTGQCCYAEAWHPLPTWIVGRGWPLIHGLRHEEDAHSIASANSFPWPILQSKRNHVESPKSSRETLSFWQTLRSQGGFKGELKSRFKSYYKSFLALFLSQYLPSVRSSHTTDNPFCIILSMLSLLWYADSSIDKVQSIGEKHALLWPFSHSLTMGML